MGSSCSCCCGDTEAIQRRDNLRRPGVNPSSRDHRFPHQALPQQGRAPSPSGRQRPSNNNNGTCAFCGVRVDPCLLEGHQESCRLIHRQRMQQHHEAVPRSYTDPQPSVTKSPAVPVQEKALKHSDADSGAVSCIICLDAPRDRAFVPCGHVVGCLNCVKALDRCPICREPRSGLLLIDSSDATRCRCKHCAHIIGPTFFEGHQEVCAMQQRLKQQQQREQVQGERANASPHNGDLSTYDESTSSTQHIEEPQHLEEDSSLPQLKRQASDFVLCVECHSQPPRAALIPCGHRVLCTTCAADVRTCPLCCQAVSGSVQIFDC